MAKFDETLSPKRGKAYHRDTGPDKGFAAGEIARNPGRKNSRPGGNVRAEASAPAWAKLKTQRRGNDRQHDDNHAVEKMLGLCASGVGRQPAPRRKRHRDGLNVFNFSPQKPQRNIKFGYLCRFRSSRQQDR